MSETSRADVLNADPLLRELIAALRPSIKTVEIERIVADDEKRVRVRIDLFGMADVHAAYIGPREFDEAGHLVRSGSDAPFPGRS